MRFHLHAGLLTSYPSRRRNPTRVSRSRLTNQMILHLISVVWWHCSRASLQHQDSWRRNEAANQLYCLHKYHNPPVSNRAMHYFVTEMCTCALVSLTNDALLDLWDVSIVSTGRPWLTCHTRVWAIFKICCLYDLVEVYQVRSTKFFPD